MQDSIYGEAVIGVHLVMFCFGHDVWLMVLGSVIVGYVMWWGYGFLTYYYNNGR